MNYFMLACFGTVISLEVLDITTTVLRPFFRDHPGELVPEENFWTLWCKGRLTEADTPTIRLGATLSGLTSAHLHHPPIFLQSTGHYCKLYYLVYDVITIWHILYLYR